MKRRFFRLMVVTGSMLVIIGCSESQQPDEQKDSVGSETARLAGASLGQSIYASRCILCHGKSGTGSKQGPPLVHNIYRPDHHSDYSIERAIKFGVRSHHWGFGNMPPVSGMSPEDIQHVTAYIRQEQIRAGIR